MHRDIGYSYVLWDVTLTMPTLWTIACQTLLAIELGSVVVSKKARHIITI